MVRIITLYENTLYSVLASGLHKMVSCHFHTKLTSERQSVHNYSSFYKEMYVLHITLYLSCLSLSALLSALIGI